MDEIPYTLFVSDPTATPDVCVVFHFIDFCSTIKLFVSDDNVCAVYAHCGKPLAKVSTRVKEFSCSFLLPSPGIVNSLFMAWGQLFTELSTWHCSWKKQAHTHLRCVGTTQHHLGKLCMGLLSMFFSPPSPFWTCFTHDNVMGQSMCILALTTVVLCLKSHTGNTHSEYLILYFVREYAPRFS